METKNRTKIVVEPGKQEIVMLREFEAPRELVFKAYTDPELFARWIGPRGYRTRFENTAIRNGGSWRMIQSNQQGEEFAFHGVYHDVTAPERIIGTFEFEGLPEPGHVLLETNLFEELPGGRTRITSRAIYQSVEDRDGMVQSGMEHGVIEGYERLDEVLAEMQKVAG